MDIQPTTFVHFAFGVTLALLVFALVIMTIIDKRKYAAENIHKKKMALIEYEENMNERPPTPKPIARP
jgi:heme exporter protein D